MTPQREITGQGARARGTKRDPVDDQNAARTVVAGEATAIPKDHRDLIGELRPG